jgi:hypothetical protein
MHFYLKVTEILFGSLASLLAVLQAYEREEENINRYLGIKNKAKSKPSSL